MRQYVENRVYDTSTSRHVGGWDNGLGHTDPSYERSDLYRKGTGEYFLVEEGGGRTRLAVRDGRRWVPGTLVTPLTFDEARSWVRENLGDAAFRDEFDTSGQGRPKPMYLRLPMATKRKLEAESARTGSSQAHIIITALEEHFARHGQEP